MQVFLSQLIKINMSVKALNIIFMGTPDFAVDCLDNLIKSKHNVLGVVTA